MLLVIPLISSSVNKYTLTLENNNNILWMWVETQKGYMYVNIYNLCDVEQLYNLFDDSDYISSNSPSNISSNIQNTLFRSFITKSQPYDFFNPEGSSIRWDGILALTIQCLPWKSNLSNYFTLTSILRGLTASA